MIRRRPAALAVAAARRAPCPRPFAALPLRDPRPAPARYRLPARACPGLLPVAAPALPWLAPSMVWTAALIASGADGHRGARLMPHSSRQTPDARIARVKSEQLTTGV